MQLIINPGIATGRPANSSCRHWITWTAVGPLPDWRSEILPLGENTSVWIVKLPTRPEAVNDLGHRTGVLRDPEFAREINRQSSCYRWP